MVGRGMWSSCGHFVAVGLNQKLFHHSISNCKFQRGLFQISKAKIEMQKVVGGQSNSYYACFKVIIQALSDVPQWYLDMIHWLINYEEMMIDPRTLTDI